MCFSKRIVSLFLIVVVISNLAIFDIFANEHDVSDVNETGSILIDYTYNSDPLDDVNFKVYKIADFVPNEEIQTTDKFLNLDIEYIKLSLEEYWIDLTGNLENYISLNQIPADMEFLTDDYGQYKLEDLSLGLYYIEAENSVLGGNTYISEPILIFVGQYDYENEKWLYHFTAQPKVSMLSYEPSPNITVTKVWENSSDEFVENQSVEIELYCNGELYDTVILSNENDWQYTWYDMCCSEDWAILETSSFENYQVTYTKEIYDFIITNTYIGESEEPETPEDPDTPEIPQTGSFANKIPLFAGVGMILILLAFILKLVGKQREN